MPKQTFFNLSDEKRAKIIEAGLNEFSDNGLKKASINIIIKSAGIPKGSFYQYFENKKDMYKYIFDLAGQEKIKYLSDVLPHIGEYGFFDSYKKVFEAGIRFGLDHPKYMKISNDLLTDTSLMHEIYGEQAGRANDFLIMFLKHGVENGDLRSDLDLELISKMLASMTIGLGELFFEKYGLNQIDKITIYTDKFIDILKKGISRRDK